MSDSYTIKPIRVKIKNPSVFIAQAKKFNYDILSQLSVDKDNYVDVLEDVELIDLLDELSNTKWTYIIKIHEGDEVYYHFNLDRHTSEFMDDPLLLDKDGKPEDEEDTKLLDEINKALDSGVDFYLETRAGFN